ncbi:MAG: hypothetical protein QMD77_01470 [Patescibacteria group bacterium]|nr:hypothetical protein [Patescibacteria group bacterium]
MLWLYIPPVILIGALITLVIVLGRKSAEIKKIRSLRKDGQTKNFEGGKTFKNIWHKILQFSEKLLLWLKIAVKKSEQSIAKLVSRIRTRRTKSMESTQIDDLTRSRFEKAEEEIEKTEDTSFDDSTLQKTEWISSEVVVRKKRIDEPVVRIKEEAATEDKIKEGALIHRIAENPRDVEAYRDLGDYYMSVGNIKDAKDSFKMVLKLRPRDLKAKSSLREIEMKMRLGS